MPARQFVIVLVLFASCLAIVGIAWASGTELYLFWFRRFGYAYPPPTHPVWILILLVTCLVLTCWPRQQGVYGVVAVTGDVLLGSVVGFFAFGWTPTWAQHVLAVAMIATSIYAWKQKDNFEE